MTHPPIAPTISRRTIRSYESFAPEYNTLISPLPPPETEAALRRLVDLARPGGTVLEIGSGPGRDADFLESLGVTVRRTDATQAFLDLQAQRGKHGELLDVRTDELGGPYDAVLAMCVLHHIERDLTDSVLGKIAGALRPDGGFLVSVREGTGETTGDYHRSLWSRAEFADRLAAAGLQVTWDTHDRDSDGDPWSTFLARKVR